MGNTFGDKIDVGPESSALVPGKTPTVKDYRFIQEPGRESTTSHKKLINE